MWAVTLGFDSYVAPRPQREHTTYAHRTLNLMTTYPSHSSSCVLRALDSGITSPDANMSTGLQTHKRLRQAEKSNAAA
jgi:hypothetical protein